MPTLSEIIGLSIAITIIAGLIRFAVWFAWPQKVQHDPFAKPHGDVPHDGRRGNG